MDPVILDGRSLTVPRVVAAARERARVELAGTARARVSAAREVVDRLVSSGAPVYGVNTGFGKLSDIAIPAERLAELQVNLIRSHSAGLGEALPESEVRALMVLRANVLARGHSGVRPEIPDLLAGMLNAGLYPPIPEQGSVGASGDLAPLAHLGLALIGEGELCQGDRRGAADVMLRAAGLAPVVLAPKEGLALINGTQAHTAVTALALHDARTLVLSAHLIGAATLDALLGTPEAFDARIHEARGQAGQKRSAAILRAMTAASEIRESHRSGDPRIQDAYSLRCMPQVHGPVLDALEFASGVVDRELNAATDNPLVFPDGAMLSGGNFHGYAVGLVADLLAMALTALSGMAERRIDRLVNPDLNQGLPPFLTRDAGVSSGFMAAQITAAAVTSECKGLAHPATVDTIPTDGGKEDVVPMSMAAAVKLRRVVANVRYVLAIELLCAMQGLDLRRPLRSSAAVEEAYAHLRSRVPVLDRDRPLAPDIAVASEMIGRGEIAGIAARHLTEDQTNP